MACSCSLAGLHIQDLAALYTVIMFVAAASGKVDKPVSNIQALGFFVS